MDVILFNEMINDKHFFNLKKMKYKYAEDFDEFIEALKNYYLSPIFFSKTGEYEVMYCRHKLSVNPKTSKLLLKDQSMPYSINSVENEMISSSLIENIDFGRESVRNILKGLAPKDETEDRIYGMKKAFDFISKRKNKITEENIYRMYMMAVGEYLADEDKLKPGRYYRHDSVVVCDPLGNVEHKGMESGKIPRIMHCLVDYINRDDNEDDLIKAAIIHFLVAYIHPYFDGNGRMARLLQLWYLIQRGYTSALFVPFSEFILKSKKEYYAAFSVIEENEKISGVLDVTPFIEYFSKNVYARMSESMENKDVNMMLESVIRNEHISEKEEKLWKFVVATYGTEEFTTKRLEKDFGDAAYATIRTFVLRFEEFGLLTGRQLSNKVKYKIAI